MNKQMSSTLAQLTTLELIEELKTRQGVEYGASGFYKTYELRKKFANALQDRESIQAEQVIIIRALEAI